MKRRVLSVLLVLVMALGLLPTGALATGAAGTEVPAGTVAPGTITSDQEWSAQTLEAGTYTIDPGVTVTLKGELAITGEVTIQGGGKLLRGDAAARFTVTGSGSYLALRNIEVDGASLESSNSLISASSSGEVTLGEGCRIHDCIKNDSRGAVLYLNAAEAVLENTVIEDCQATLYGGAIYIENGSGLTIHSGTYKGNRTTGSTTGTKSYGGGFIYNRASTLTIYGGNYINNTSVGKAGCIYNTGVDNTKTYLYGGYFEGNKSTFTSSAGISYVGSGAVLYSAYTSAETILNLSGNLQFCGDGDSASGVDGVFLDSDNGTSIIRKAQISSELKYPLRLYLTAEEGRVVAEGVDGYTLQKRDMKKIKFTDIGTSDTQWYAKLDEENNQLILTATDPGYQLYVTYAANGGAGNVSDTAEYTSGATVTVLSGTGLQRDGYTFNGWNTKPDGTGTSYQAGGSFQITDDITLYAQWTEAEKYTATVNNGTGGGEYEAGATVTITANDPESGKEFEKWDITSGSVTLADATSSTTTFTMPAGAVEVTATYTASRHTHAVSVDCETDSGAQVTFLPLTSENGALYVDGAAAEVSQLNSGAYLLPAGNYYLAGDVRLDRQIRLTSQAQEADPANSTVNFCLNGYKLEYAGDHNYSPVIYVGTNAYALNICDCNPTGTDRTGNVIDDPVSGYTEVIWGGVITGGRYGGVTGGDAPVTLYGGTIAGNGWATGSIPVYGGGVDADNFVMCGGAIRYNKALYGGGVNAGGSFTMTGGTISDNWATTKNGGVHTVISSGTPTAVTLSGSAKITGNVMGDEKTAASNLNLVKDCVVTVGPEGLGEAFQVGISTSAVPDASAPVTVAQGSGDTALTADDLAKFSSDNSKYELKLSNGKIVLAVKPAHVHAWATAWSKDANGHWHACTAQGCGITDYASCGETDAAYAAHVYDNDQDATCNTCGYTRTVTPPDPGPGPEPQPGESKGEVEVKPGTPAVAVDEETLKDLAGEAQDGQTVTVKLTVEKQEAPAHKTELEALVSGRKDDVLYLDLSLLKTTVRGDSDSAAEAITDTGETVLEIAVPYDFTGKKDVTAYRKHGESAAETLTTLSERPTENAADGSFFADRAGGVVYLYASKFSTYAIGYTAESSGANVPNTYKPNLHQPEHGTLTVSPAAPSKGKTVTITPKPEEGYEVDTLTVTDKNGKSLEVTKNANGTYTFTQPSGRANISAAMKEATAAGDNTATAEFTDVSDTAWYHDDVYYCVEKGLMKGTGDTTFAPEVTTSRAMIAAILWRLAGEPGAKAAANFPDCVADSWYATAVAWGTESGVVKGYDSGKFGPDDPITREQLAVMLWRYAKFAGMDVSVGGDTNILSYKDFSEIGGWAVEGLQWAAGAGIVNGKPDGLLDPLGRAMRAEAAAMLRRFCELEK